MRQYTIKELVKEYEKKGFTIFLYNNATDNYTCGNDDLDKNLLEWQHINSNIVVDIMEENNEVVLFYYEEEEPEEEEKEVEGFSVDDIYRENGFTSEADFWRWKEGL